MAIEIKVTKEIGNYETKVISTLTLRQLVSLIAAAPIAWVTFNVVSQIASKEAAGFACMLLGAIPCAFGFIKPYGMHTEKFLKSIFVNRIMAPQTRKYITENTWESFEHMADEQMKEKSKADNKDKNVKYHISPEAIK